MSDWPLLRLRPIADERDEAFILRLAPLFASFALPAWRSRHHCIQGLREGLARRLEGEEAEGELWLAETADGVTVGFIGLSLSRDYFSGQRQAHLNELAVAPEHQRQGHGQALLALAEAWARRHGCKALTLNVFPENAAARRLYAGAGYQLDLLRLAKPL